LMNTFFDRKQIVRHLNSIKCSRENGSQIVKYQCPPPLEIQGKEFHQSNLM
jgi:hypothetical protein